MLRAWNGGEGEDDGEKGAFNFLVFIFSRRRASVPPFVNPSQIHIKAGVFQLEGISYQLIQDQPTTQKPKMKVGHLHTFTN